MRSSGVKFDWLFSFYIELRFFVIIGLQRWNWKYGPPPGKTRGKLKAKVITMRFFCYFVRFVCVWKHCIVWENYYIFISLTKSKMNKNIRKILISVWTICSPQTTLSLVAKFWGIRTYVSGLRLHCSVPIVYHCSANSSDALTAFEMSRLIWLIIRSSCLFSLCYKKVYVPTS